MGLLLVVGLLAAGCGGASVEDKAAAYYGGDAVARSCEKTGQHVAGSTVWSCGIAFHPNDDLADVGLEEVESRCFVIADGRARLVTGGGC